MTRLSDHIRNGRFTDKVIFSEKVITSAIDEWMYGTVAYHPSKKINLIDFVKRLHGHYLMNGIQTRNNGLEMFQNAKTRAVNRNQDKLVMSDRREKKRKMKEDEHCRELEEFRASCIDPMKKIIGIACDAKTLSQGRRRISELRQHLASESKTLLASMYSNKRKRIPDGIVADVDDEEEHEEEEELQEEGEHEEEGHILICLLYTSPSPRDRG